MRIKGTALLARKAIIEGAFGAEAWSTLLADMRKTHAYFDEPLNAASLIPVPDFLAIHDEIVRRFYGGDVDVYFRLGEQSAEWALTVGPYKGFMTRKDLASFVDSFPSLWTAYFHETTSTCVATMEGDVVMLDARNLPVWHPYFEYLVVGYMKKGLELLGVHAKMRALHGGPTGGRSFRYEFRLTT
jgi:hypothetical protein